MEHVNQISDDVMNFTFMLHRYYLACMLAYFSAKLYLHYNNNHVFLSYVFELLISFMYASIMISNIYQLEFGITLTSAIILIYIFSGNDVYNRSIYSLLLSLRCLILYCLFVMIPSMMYMYIII